MATGVTQGCFDGLDLSHALRLEILYVGRSKVDASWSGVSDVTYTTYKAFHLVCDGAARLRVQGQEYELQPGRIYYIPSYYTTTRVCDSEYDHVYGGFSCRDIVGNDLLCDQKLPLDLGTFDLASLPEDRSQFGTVAEQLYVKTLLIGALLRYFPGLKERLNQPLGLSARFSKSMGYIKENLSAKLEVKTLAELEGLSRNAYSRAFKNATGVTPKAYLNNELNQVACRMVLTSNINIRKIGQELGFTDEYYFNRFFSRMNGMPPLRYRRALS